MSAGKRVRALAIAATCSLAAVLTVALPSQPVPAQAADMAAFQAGNIISDAVFYDSTSMSAAAIQSFLAKKGSSCVAGWGRTCLKNYRETTGARAADSYCTGGLAAATETAAQIIAKVAVSCRINPQVLIVMLQKEEGLVTLSAGGSIGIEYRSAMGFGCPDTAVCNSQYYGFFNQVYSAAHQFQYYARNPLGYAHVAGMVNEVLYSPNAACGSSRVFIQDQATASLYNYTPYQPNAAALAAGYGSGNSCSAYGNRNFWEYFTDWFGPTSNRAPVGSLDTATTSAGVIAVRGWALDPDTTASIHVDVYVDGRASAALEASGKRTDVGRIYGMGDSHGFSGSVRAVSGAHEVCVYAIDPFGGGNPRIGCKAVKVANRLPIGALDTATSSQGRIVIRGWALDPDTTAPINVHVYVDGKATQSVTGNTSRLDVGHLYGKGNNHGFVSTVNAVAGTHQVCAYAIDSTGGSSPRIGCKNVDVLNRAPIGALDSVKSGMGSFTMRGWALDPDTTGPVTIFMYVDGKKVRAFTANTSRTDVGHLYGKGNNHGFAEALSEPYGEHAVCVFAIDSWGGANTKVACATVDVNGLAFGALDSAVATAGKVTVRGWAIDPNTSGPIMVQVTDPGQKPQTLTANTSRPDVGRLYRMGNNHGFAGTVKASAGTHPVCVYAMDSFGWGTNPLIKCLSVRVP
jgi:hypothetical protein